MTSADDEHSVVERARLDESSALTEGRPVNEAPDPVLEPQRFESRILGNTRSIWLPRARSGSRAAMVFLDGEHYLRDIGAAAITEDLQRAGLLDPTLLPVYVSHIDYPTRWRESCCNPDFVAFLCDELLPWLGHGDAEHNVLIGLSLTGLSAAHAALLRPHSFPRVYSQSASFWWRDGWLVDEVARLPGSELALQLAVGTREVDENVDHGDGLFQKESQRSSNRRMRDVLTRMGYRHRYREFEGGHDVASFRTDLREGLIGLAEL